jgi:hypothetical protein
VKLREACSEVIKGPELYRRPSLRLGLSTGLPLYIWEVSHYLLEASKGAYTIVS